MIVIKVGGNLINKLNKKFFDQIKDLQNNGEKIILVHGGGNLISESCDFMGIPTKKINGIRVTNSQVMDIIDNLLTKIVQPQLKNIFSKYKIQSTMLNSNNYPFLKGDYLDQEKYGEVGVIHSLDAKYIDVMSNNSVALCAPIAYGIRSQKLNINADSAAKAISVFTNASKLIFLTDVPGVMLNDQVLNNLNHQRAMELIENKTLVNGMIPKVQSALSALDSGIKNISITNDLNSVGTAIVS